MLILDTDHLPPADRMEAYHAAAVGKTGSCTIEPGVDDLGRFHMRMEVWQFGALTLFSNAGSGMRYRQTERNLRHEDWNTVAISNQAAGRGGFVWNGRQRRMSADDLSFASRDARSWETNWTGTGESVAFLMHVDRIGLPDGVVHRAMPLAEQSTLTPLLLSQMRLMRADADRLHAEPDVTAIGEAVIALVRGIIASVSGSTPLRRAVAEETRLTRIIAHLFTHLTDPGLSAARVAAVHNLTVPALHRVFHDADLDFDQWLTHHRLEGARDDLTSPHHAHRALPDIARSWGFADPDQFAAAFRRAYHATPAEYRRHGR